MRKQQKDVIVYRLIPMPHNSAQVIVMESASRGAIWDIKARKLIRTLPSFSGVITNDGRLGLHAPNRGGLHVSCYMLLYMLPSIFDAYNETYKPT